MIKREKGICKKCNNFNYLYSKNICQRCYWIERKKISIEKNVYKDEQTYLDVYNCKPHKCEECGEPLSNKFKDDKGRIIDRWQYSHILGKKAHPVLRNNPLNFNRLCFSCHQKWEFGDRKSMRIYENNLIIIEKLLELEQKIQK